MNPPLAFGPIYRESPPFPPQPDWWYNFTTQPISQTPRAVVSIANSCPRWGMGTMLRSPPRRRTSEESDLLRTPTPDGMPRCARPLNPDVIHPPMKHTWPRERIPWNQLVCQPTFDGRVRPRGPHSRNEPSGCRGRSESVQFVRDT